MLKVVIPDSNDKLKKQIKALKFQLTQDVREEDKKIHQEALNASVKALNFREGYEKFKKENPLLLNNYDEWVESMEKDIKEGYRCSKCGNIIVNDNNYGSLADDEICKCNL